MHSAYCYISIDFFNLDTFCILLNLAGFFNLDISPVKMLCPKKKKTPHLFIFVRNKTCLNVGLLMVGHVSVISMTVFRWVATKCCFASEMFLRFYVCRKQLRQV